MDNRNNVATRSNISGVIAYVGAAVCAIPLFTIVSYASKGESPYTMILALRSLLFIIGFGLIGTGVFQNNPQHAKGGLIVSAIGFVFCAIFPIMWISENTKYYDSLKEGLSGGNGYLLLSYIAAFIGLILMWSAFSNEQEMQSSTKSIALGAIALYLLITVLYAFWDIDDLSVTFGEYIKYYIDGSGTLAIVGVVGALLLPSAFPDNARKVPKISPVASTSSPVTTPAANQFTNPTAVSAKNSTPSADNSLEDAVATIRKYKELLDMGIITQEEFQDKKSELLKL